MSRCFPFPPPGYEKKDRPDDANVIIKEQHKHKKHKDKKHKDKKEKSKRKEKEKTEGKVKEDKDRKRKKHRDKKDKKREEKRNSSEEGSVVSSENQDGGKLDKPTDGVQDYRSSAELGRIANDGGPINKQMAQKITLITQTKLPSQVQENRSGVANGNSLRVESRVVENAVVGNFFGENQSKVNSGSWQVDNVEKGKEHEDKNVLQTGDAREDGGKKKNKDKKSKEEKERRKEEKKKRKEEKKKEKVKKDKSKEVSKQNDGYSNFQGLHRNPPQGNLKESRDSNFSKRKERESNGYLHENGIRPTNISRPASSSHHVRQNQNGFVPPQKVTSAAVEKGDVVINHKPNGKLSSTQPTIENGRDIKAQNANNFTAEHSTPSIINRTVKPSQLDNYGRKMEPCEIAQKTTKLEDRAVDSCRIDDKIPSRSPLVQNGKIVRSNSHQSADGRGVSAGTEKNKKDSGINGIVLVDKASDTPSTSSASVITVEKRKKPPHPDLKYLSQILTVPDVLECPEDDQEWLFGCKEAKRPKLAASAVEETTHVWDKAMHLESANVTALPYVIPY